MRKLLIISFFLLLLLAQVGYYFIYSYRQTLAKKEAREQIMAGLPDDQLQLVILEDNAAAIRWEEAGKEFWLGKQIYDVVRTRNVDGKTYLYCLNDSKEKSIAEHKQQATQSANGKAAKSAFKFQLPDIIITSVEGTRYTPVTRTTLFIPGAAPILSVVTELAGPPPRA